MGDRDKTFELDVEYRKERSIVDSNECENVKEECSNLIKIIRYLIQFYR